jgi:hypothetical protein
MAQNSNVVLGAVAIVVIIVLAAYFIIQDMKPKATISATGNSQLSVTPDQAVIHFSITTRSKTAQVAKDENALISDKVLMNLLKIGIERKDIETINYNIYPEYDWVYDDFKGGTQVLKGYVATNELQVTTTNFNDVGKIVDNVVDPGALINYINFELSNDKNNQYKTEALSKASLDAKNRAESVANGLGKKLGSVVSVSTSDYYYNPYPIYREGQATPMKESIDTNIIPRNLDVSATVSVVYNIV